VGNVIRLPGDRHREIQLLLPWYVTGRLDEADTARVETHLAGCAKCRAELKVEQRLDQEVAGLPLGVEQSWAAMRRRIEATPLEPGGRVRAWAAALGRDAGGAWRVGGPWLGWAFAAAAALVVIAGPLPRTPQPAAYHALGAATGGAAGNVIVIFRSDASEAAMRQSLGAADARVVDGPTAAGAYVLRVPAAERERALSSLRTSGVVRMAEPIDGGGSR
jgi:hypothetical protein